MLQSESISQLTTALSLAQAVIKAAAKDSTNPHFQSNYADLASVWSACRDPLTANGLSVIQLPSADGAKVTVITMLAHKSGEWISSDLTLTAQQNTPQGIGSAIKYARRYALEAIAGVASDDDDGEGAEGRGDKSKQQPRPAKSDRKPDPPERRPEPQERKADTPASNRRITEDERKQLFAVVGDANITQAEALTILKGFGFTSTAEVTAEKFEAVKTAIRAKSGGGN